MNIPDQVRAARDDLDERAYEWLNDADRAAVMDEPPPALPERLARQLGLSSDGSAPDPAVEEHGRGGLVNGAAFILDAPALPPAIWGRGGDVLWAEGEPLLLVGPVGVGKTTLAGQIVRARLGIGHGEVLGYPVKAGRKLLYLACDRPPQIGRSMGRMFAEEDRPALAERLAVWPGPPPADLARNPGLLLQLARNAGADTVVIDSLKDAAIGLSADDVGAGLNWALQMALVGGVQVFGLHHQTKRGAGGTGPPDTLADVYGSVWITAGAGSVILAVGGGRRPRSRPAAPQAPGRGDRPAEHPARPRRRPHRRLASPRPAVSYPSPGRSRPGPPGGRRGHVLRRRAEQRSGREGTAEARPAGYRGPGHTQAGRPRWGSG